MTRRDMINGIVRSMAIIGLVPILETCTKITDTQNTGPIVIDLKNASYSALANTGGSVSVQDVIVINTGNEQFVALSNICTHQGCQVAFNRSRNALVCPCHFSSFSTSGNVINGPALAPLQSYNISRDGDVLTVTR